MHSSTDLRTQESVYVCVFKNQVAFIKRISLVNRGNPRFFTPFSIFLHLRGGDFECRETLRFLLVETQLLLV